MFIHCICLRNWKPSKCTIQRIGIPNITIMMIWHLHSLNIISIINKICSKYKITVVSNDRIMTTLRFHFIYTCRWTAPADATLMVYVHTLQHLRNHGQISYMIDNSSMDKMDKIVWNLGPTPSRAKRFHDIFHPCSRVIM